MKTIDERIEKLGSMLRKQASIPNISAPKLKQGNRIKVPEIGDSPKTPELVSKNKKVDTNRTEPPNLNNNSSGPEFQSKMNKNNPYRKNQ